MDSYPTLYAVEADVLNNLFFAGRREYCWYQGALFIDDDGPKEYDYNSMVDQAKENSIEFAQNSLEWEKNNGQRYVLTDNLKEYIKCLEDNLLFEMNATPEQHREKEINKRIEYCKEAVNCPNDNFYKDISDTWKLLPEDKIGIVVDPPIKDGLLSKIQDDIQKDWLDIIKRTIGMIGTELIPSNNWKEKDFAFIESIKNKVYSMKDNPVFDVKIPELDTDKFEVLTEEEYFDRYYPKSAGNWKEFYNIDAYRKNDFGIAWMCYKKYGYLCSEVDGKMKVQKWDDSYSSYIHSFFMECRMSILCPYITQDNKWWAQVTLRKEESNLDLYTIYIGGCDDASWSLHVIGLPQANEVIEKLKRNITPETLKEFEFFFTN